MSDAAIITINKKSFKLAPRFNNQFPLQANFPGALALYDEEKNIIPKDNQGMVDVHPDGRYRLADVSGFEAIHIVAGASKASSSSAGGPRKLSGYNLFSKEYRGDSGHFNMKESAAKWSTLSDDEKHAYNERALAAKTEPAGEADQPKPAKQRKLQPKSEAPVVSSTSAAGAAPVAPKPKMVKPAQAAPAGTPSVPKAVKPAAPKTPSQSVGGAAPTGTAAPKMHKPKAPQQSSGDASQH